MKKRVFLLFALFFMITLPGLAADYTGDDLLLLLNLTPETATQVKVTSMLGKPVKIEENKKRTMWYYSHGNTNLVLSWDNESLSLQKFSFTSTESKKNDFDNNLAGKLKAGATSIKQALQLLGTPKDVTIKEKTQEMHYAYQQKVLRLFFRNRVLVDFCLY